MSDKKTREAHIRQLIQTIHASSHRAVIAITGGGAEAVGELLRYGGGSATLLEAIIPYTQKSFDEFVHGTPDKYCSAGAARDLAMAAFQRAIKLDSLDNADKLIGIGATCSLAKNQERDDREHHAYIAAQTIDQTITFSLNLTPAYLATLGVALGGRTEEESVVSEAILALLAAGCKIETPVLTDYLGVVLNGSYETTKGNLEEFRLLTGQPTSRGRSIITNAYRKGNKELLPDNYEDRVVYPGAFHPFHEQHEKIASKAHEITGKFVDLEVCVHNVDKPVLNYKDISERWTQLQTVVRESQWGGLTYFTPFATFVEKAKAFPGATFVVGWDTFQRIGDPKYGNLEEVMRVFEKQRIKFLVFHRIMDGKSSEHEPLDSIYPPLLKIAQIVPTTEFTPRDMSSSKIRKQLT